MAPDTPLLPRYYLVHDTPQGRRVAYPAPTLNLPTFPTHNPHHVTWHSPDGDQLEVTGGWLVARESLPAVRASWLPSAEYRGFRKRTEPPTDQLIRTVWEEAPDTPPDDQRDHYLGCLECGSCSVFRAIYEQVKHQPPVQIQVIDLSEWVRLPGELDPEPTARWALTDPSLVAVYGAHTAHLWPGYIPGLRDRIFELLKKDPRVQYVFDAKNHPTQGRGTLQTTVPIPWEKPRTRLRDRTGADGRKLRGREPVPDPIAHTATTTLRVPEGLTGVNKAAALAQWEQTVTYYINQLVPTNVVACDRCDGHGHLNTTPEEGT